MTRINIIPPIELTDQHLVAEIREINQLCAHFEKSLKSKKGINGIPDKFTLNTGHVKFFYNRRQFLKNRFESLVKEGKNRGFNIQTTFNDTWSKNNVVDIFNKDYTPDITAYTIIRERIKEKLLMRKHWYRYYGKPITDEFITNYGMVNTY